MNLNHITEFMGHNGGCVTRKAVGGGREGGRTIMCPKSPIIWCVKCAGRASEHGQSARRPCFVTCTHF